MAPSRRPESDQRGDPRAAESQPATLEAPTGAAFDDPALERRIGEIGRSLLKHARGRRTSLLSRAYWSERLMNRATQDEAFKNQLFRFIDAFPAFKTPRQVHEHLADYFLRGGVPLPAGLGPALKAGGLVKSAMSRLISGQIRSMAARFIAGADIPTAAPILARLWANDTAHTITLLGERCLSAGEALAYQQAHIRVLREVAAAAANWPAGDRAEHDHLGPIPRVNLSLKLSALHPTPDPLAIDTIAPILRQTIQPILDEAKRLGAQIHIDSEQRELKELVFEVFMRCAEASDVPIGVVVQAYLRSAEEDAQRIIDWTRRTGRQVTIRLVKGAYWDHETAHAARMGWPVPVWSRKSDTDACFERVAKMFIQATPRSAREGGVRLALGSHNARSIAAVLALIEQHDLPPEAVELQMLYGMAGELKTAAAALKLRVREYVPVGRMIPGMAYLVRRLLENTSNESWLKASFRDHVSAEALLASPHRSAATPDQDIEDPGDARPFRHEPPRDFADRSVRRAFAEAIGRIPPHDDGIEMIEEKTDRALASALAALPGWSERSARERTAVLVNAAADMRRRRDELAAVIIGLAGQCWREANKEVCRAIDFCAYHARQAVNLFEAHPDCGGPLGVMLIAAPLDEPLAGLCGLATAALVTGNTVLVSVPRPARAIAGLFCSIMRDAGCPAEALHLLIEEAQAVADHHPDVHRIEVDRPDGGSVIIVDESADPDSAVLGVRRAAFGAAGRMPCSCRRVVSLQAVHDTFVHRLCESTKALRIGDPADPATDIGPVLDDQAQESINAFIALGRTEAHAALAMELPEEAALMGGRHYVAPHIFRDVPPAGVFANRPCPGPVLSIMKSASFPEALRLARSFTGTTAVGLYSRTPSNIEKTRAAFSATDLFINRPVESIPVGRPSMDGVHLARAGAQLGAADSLRRFLRP